MTKYVPKDQYLLKNVKIKATIPDVNNEELKGYLRQTPNNTILGFWPLKLGFYNASSEDSTKWSNRWLRRIGEPPVIYDSLKTIYGCDELQKVIFNKGYLNANVTFKTTINPKKRHAKVTYSIEEGEPYRLRNYFITIPDSSALEAINQREKPLIKPGDLFDIDRLNEEREQVAKMLRNQGYYNFRKELLFFYVDSALNTHEIDAELSIQPQYLDNDSALQIIFTKKEIENVTILALKDNDLLKNDLELDTFYQNNIKVIYNKKNKAFRPKALINKTSIQPNRFYSDFIVDRTYSRLNSLNAAKYVNISFTENSNNKLDAQIVITQNKPHTVSAEIEGTYSGGDLGVGAAIGYKNNNIFRGSEILNININGGYEAIGSLSEYQSAWDIGGEASLTFPTLLMPMTKDFRQRSTGTTEIAASVNFQQRPEYQRNIASAGIKYNWRWRRVNFTFNLLDLSYIYLPYMTAAFKDKYMRPTSSIRFSYEDHFIMRWGLGINMSNRRNMTFNTSSFYTFRTNVRTAGNLLYGISHLIKQQKNEDGVYEIFNIQYSQFAKADIDFAYNWYLTDKSRLVFHTGLGVGIPYGNASILPFEERYYSGGANSMRGWAARKLGPGNFYNSSGSIDFMKQSGDIKFDLNLEARFRLIWKLEAAVFVDAGNIWTIRDYAEQPTGAFRWNEFYKQIACNYGVGLRLDFDFFVIRVDMGIKLYDPGYPIESERWRTDLTWRDDFALHFAVGYPF
ncbi:MAG: BamA/TamA family outer membrane protein [Paludibacteraceae bacterium]|nr:BamA/TamA family outer membrane protein [Paludibacteraceae bacterium]